MEYTVQKLGQLAGVSTRTLRYYDEIGLLKPARINSSGYRIYGQQEVNRLQQILFYRELGLHLEKIRDIMNDPDFDSTKALKDHHENLLNKKEQLDLLIANVEKSIAAHERGITMTDQEKFEGFKEKLIEENEKLYGKEIREKYGQDAVNRSNDKLKRMTAQEHEELTRLADELYETLGEAFKTGDPAGDLAQKAAELHKQWLCFYWDRYSKEAHRGLAQMYVDDERFRQHYDKNQPGTAEFLRDAIHVYTSN
ncbi:MerR family transcriptional regulator [Fictibacillus enclensis]|uniref:MerR family transcriptional regulator n=1 Tax=Fictibacillus enclensis TaxID=1017270 RepID=UPI0024BF5446|nr:MerR family transcriptional regulator [Fictibacillus enclensis]WHY73709.1 MerR family transcriptional regulator [Fictibacillus enclensis]